MPDDELDALDRTARTEGRLPLAAIVSTVVFRRSRWFGSGWQVFSFWAGLISLATGPIVGIGLLDATKLHSVAANRAVGDRVAGYATS